MNDDRSEAVARLRYELAPLRGLWAGFEADLAAMGVSHLSDLMGRSADQLLREYSRLVERPLDFVLWPYFEAAVRFARTGQVTPTWTIMREEAVREQNRIVSASLA